MITYHMDIWILLGFALQFILPPLVGLVTTKVQPDSQKALLLAALSAVIAIITAALSAHDANQQFDIYQAALDALGGFVVSAATHFGIWKPTGVAEKAMGMFRKDPIPASSPASPAIVTGPGSIAQSDSTAPATPAPPSA